MDTLQEYRAATLSYCETYFENKQDMASDMKTWKRKDWFILLAVIAAAILLGAVCGKVVLDNII